MAPMAAAMGIMTVICRVAPGGSYGESNTGEIMLFMVAKIRFVWLFEDY